MHSAGFFSKAETVNKSSESTSPHYFQSVEQLLQSKELQTQDNELVYFAVGSYNTSGARESCGYAQSLPLFVENLLRDPNNRVKIILCDPHWTEQEFAESDLARYLQEKGLYNNGNKIYFVSGMVTNHHFPRLVEYFTSILNKNGVVFLNEIEIAQGPSLIKIYENLLKNTKNNPENHLYAFKWLFLTTVNDEGKRSLVTVEQWNGKPFNKIDRALLLLRVSHLDYIISTLSGDNERFHRDRLEAKYKDKLPELADSYKREEQELINEFKEATQKCQSMIGNQEALLNDLITYASAVLLNQYNITNLNLSNEEKATIKKLLANPTHELTCSVGSLIPTKHLPLIDLEVRATPSTRFNLLDMYNEKTISEAAGLVAVSHSAAPKGPGG